ncbi:MAG TPA: DUF742 domain-containing protein [Actinophytocola sp.]|uniref:DUF742 domain-containing protein n=1 Tax=Actinophytocola sp. TaxID=1872138 RepID=UPI002DDCA8A8|nr:DUF742 domain-containing protein [Actinophytocola sp.]HEV2784316.1 DUF742 domain-containing protein [Actinophytocola sp.]
MSGDPGDTVDRDVSLLRPYLLTSGRAQPIDDTLEIEAQVATSRLGEASQSNLTFERKDIVALCRTGSKSVAEVAAILGLHIGVARVLVADLAALGYVIVRRPGIQLSQDLDMIERVIRGLEAIR